MAEKLRVGEVFVPGKIPDATYNPREQFKLETRVEDYIDEGGSILTVSGPTKTGKSVLIQHKLPESVRVQGQGITSLDELWGRVVDQLGLFADVSRGNTAERSDSGTGGGSIGASSTALKTEFGYQESAGSNYQESIQRPVGAVAREALAGRKVPLVIDDFHFIDRDVQREIVRALKPLVLEGVPAILISVSHRLRDAVVAEPDMSGRVESLEVGFWEHDELLEIARSGFEAMNVTDTDSRLAHQLAESAFGSPHLMQRFCRELCKANGVRRQQDETVELQAPEDWATFFRAQVDEAALDWLRRLLRGPQERGKPRNKWSVHAEGPQLDVYAITLLAVAQTGPALELSKDEIKEAVGGIIVSEGPVPGQTTRALQQMSRIAARRLTDPVPTDEELALENPDFLNEVQPVVEWIDDEAYSRLHLADPLFAFCLKWAGAEVVSAQSD